MAETCANPLLLGWIKEWLDQARERNSKGFTIYKKAYESMKACPLEFSHPSEAIQLSGLGPKLCDRLTDKLKEHCDKNGLPMPELPSSKRGGQKRNSGDDVPDAEQQPAKKTRKPKPYIPALRSGAYALILGLSTINENSSQTMTKAQLIDVAQPHSDTSFTAPSDPTKFYTAWNSMKTLIQKELVYEHGRPLRKYALTEEGWECAKRIRGAGAAGQLPQGQSTLNSTSATAILQPATSTNTASSRRTPRTIDLDDFEVDVLDDVEPAPAPRARPRNNNAESIILPPGSFTIELLLDSREVRAKNDRDYIAKELETKGIAPHVRALELGDAMWVAKCKDPNYLAQYGEEGDEVMLDWIVERKRLDDLIGSIKDGRFHEQKFRLRRSGIKNVVYLIEEFAVSHPSSTGTQAPQNYHDAVASAIASTQVVNGYFVKKTKNLDDTIRYLARMTFLLKKMYEPSIPTSSSQVSSSAAKSTSVALIPSSNLSSSESYLKKIRALRAANDSSSSSSTTFGVSFASFSALSSKSDILTLRDVFLKMLMCTRGITGDKALEIQRHWHTPRQFIEAFEAAEQAAPGRGETAVKAKEKLLTDKLGNLVAKKKVAGVLSRKVAEIWGEEG